MGLYTTCLPEPIHCTVVTGFIKLCSPLFCVLQPYSLSSFLSTLTLVLLYYPDSVSSTFMPHDHTPSPESASTPQTFPSIGHCLPLPSLPSEFRWYHFMDLFIIWDPQMRENRWLSSLVLACFTKHQILHLYPFSRKGQKFLHKTTMKLPPGPGQSSSKTSPGLLHVWFWGTAAHFTAINHRIVCCVEKKGKTFANEVCCSHHPTWDTASVWGPLSPMPRAVLK